MGTVHCMWLLQTEYQLHLHVLIYEQVLQLHCFHWFVVDQSQQCHVEVHREADILVHANWSLVFALHSNKTVIALFNGTMLVQLVLDGCIEWNAHNTVFGSKRLAYGGTQQPPKSRNTNCFLRQKRHFVEPDRKIPEFNSILKVKFRKLNPLPQPKCNFWDKNDIFGNKTACEN